MSRAYSRGDVAAVVDHTLLKPEATQRDVAALVAEAAELGRLLGVRIADDGRRRQGVCARGPAHRLGGGISLG